MNVQSLPIGIFDSGLGGLTVALEVQALLPWERLLYAADSRFCPYGTRTPEEIQWRSHLIASALIERGAKLLIIACNTATAVSLEALRERFQIPIIGLEPAVKPAVALSANGRIGVLTTSLTAVSDRLRNLITRYGTSVTVHIEPAPGLVELVEDGLTRGEEADRQLRTYMQPLIERGVDTIVLGCTHYPFLTQAIQAIGGESITLVDSGAAIARRARDLIESAGIAAGEDSNGGIELVTTGDVEHVAEIAQRLLGRRVPTSYLDLPHYLDHQFRYEAALEPKLSSACTVSSSAGA